METSVTTLMVIPFLHNRLILIVFDTVNKIEAETKCNHQQRLHRISPLYMNVCGGFVFFFCAGERIHLIIHDVILFVHTRACREHTYFMYEP